MHKILFKFLFLYLFCNIQIGFTQSDTLSAVDLAESRLSAYIAAKRIFDISNLPGMAIAVSYQGDIIYQEGIGYEDIEEHIYVRPDTTQFRIASISKALTSIALAKAVEKDKIDLDKAIQYYVPHYPIKNYMLTVRQVACHTGGVRHYKGREFYKNKEYLSLANSLNIFKKDKLEFEPGTEFSYSSYGWNLIGAALEGAYKYDFQRIMDDIVLDPLDLDKTMIELNNVHEENLSAFYEYDGQSEIQYAPEVNNSYKLASGGYISTATDLIKFANALLDEQIIERETWDQFTTPCQLNNKEFTNYGMGWATNVDKLGRSWVGHSGGGVGATSMLLIYPEYDFIVVMLVNMTDAKTKDLPFRLAESFLSRIDRLKTKDK